MPLEIDGLAKRYGPIVALRGVSLRLESSSILGLVGPNGAGKSTLIKSVVGLVVPDSGRILVDGIPANTPEGKKLVAYSPEVPVGPDWARVCDLLERLAWIEGMSLIEARRKAREAARMLGLDDLCNRLYGKLSKGQKKRVMIAQVLVAEDRRYYLFDEPFTGLDPEWVARAREVLVGLQRQGAGVLVSSHILRELEAIIDRVTIIRRGSVIYEGSLEDLANTVGQKPILIIRTLDTGLAARIIEQAGYKPRLETSSTVRVELENPSEAETILSMLRSGGVRLQGYEVKQASLEDAYLRLVHGER